MRYLLKLPAISAGLILASGHAVAAEKGGKEEPARAYRAPAPLFETLLDRGQTVDNPFRGHHVTWPHPVMLESYYGALQSGDEYSMWKNGGDLSKVNFHLYLRENIQGRFKNDKAIYWKSSNNTKEHPINYFARMHREHGWSKPMLYGPWYIRGRDAQGRLGTGKSPESNDGWLGDPINQAAFLHAIDTTLDAIGDDLWGVSMGDEETHWLHQNGLEILGKYHDQSDPDSFLRKVNEEVKRDYGFGRFGIPFNMEKDHPDYPYCNRAYRAWINAVVRRVNRKVYELVKAKRPGMAVMTEDAAGNYPGAAGSLEYWREHADIGSFQMKYLRKDLPLWTFQTKLYKDISEMENLWVVPHECDSGYAHGAVGRDDQLSLYSQLILGGATGFHSWPIPLGGAGKTVSKPRAVASDVGYPLGWSAVLQMAERINTLPPLRYPEQTDTAILVSNESVLCDPQQVRPQAYAFAHIGPQAGGWFRYISDTLLKLGRARLGDYKIVYVPAIQYSDQTTVDALIAYCEQGGTVVCGDPLAFSNDISSKPMDAMRERLFGVRIKGETTAKRVEPMEGEALPFLSEVNQWDVDDTAYDVAVTAAGATVRARFDNGKPAMVENKVGEGRAIYFAWRPWRNGSLGSPAWVRFFTNLHKELGGTVGHDIWRFQLPDETLKYQEPKAPGELCLTGNYARWRRARLIDGGALNADIAQGNYTVDSGGQRNTMPFRKGSLTNRLLLLREPKRAVAVKGWGWRPEHFDTATWVLPLKDETTVTFHFDQARRFTAMRLFYAGEPSPMTIETSMDGKQWTPMEESGKSGVFPTAREREVLLHRVGLERTRPGRHLRLRFDAPASPTSKGMIAEIEIWGEKTSLSPSADDKEKQEVKK